MKGFTFYRLMKRRKAAYKKKNQNKFSMLMVTIVVITLMCVVIVRGVELQKKIDARYEEIDRLEAQIDEEKKRSEEIEEYGKYVQTKGFYEEVAKEKLNLAYPDEIVFKEDN